MCCSRNQGAHMPYPPYGQQMNESMTPQISVLPGPQNYMMNPANAYGYEYCPSCGHRAYKCRCERRARRNRGYCGSCGGGRRRRNNGPISMLISAGVHLYQTHQAKKDDQRRMVGEEFTEKLKQEERERELKRELANKEGHVCDESDETEDEDADEVEAPEYEQHRQKLDEQSRKEQPPSYQAAMKGK